MLAEIAEAHGRLARSKSFLPRRVSQNSAGLLIYRADYELQSLRKSRKLRNKAFEGAMQSKDADTFATYSRELERWIERERILLRIPMPRGGKETEKRANSPQRGLVVQEAEPIPTPSADKTG